MNDADAPQSADVRVGSATDGRAPVSVVHRSLIARPTHWLGLSLIAGAAILADQLTKTLISHRLDLGESVHVFGPFYLHHVKNSGIAFGFFQGAASLVTILTAIVVVWMFIYFARSGAKHPVLPVALGFLIGGSIANLIDRLRSGKVTDFIDPQHWPAFNLADVFITVGVIILLASLAAAERRPRLASRRSDG